MDAACSLENLVTAYQPTGRPTFEECIMKTHRLEIFTAYKLLYLLRRCKTPQFLYERVSCKLNIALWATMLVLLEHTTTDSCCIILFQILTECKQSTIIRSK
jgi:hypothetical protein